MSILVSGGAGYIGSHTCIELVKAGYDIIVADNMINSSEESIRRVEKILGCNIPMVKVELCNPDEVEALFNQYPDIDSVIHFAVHNFVFSSSATVYGDPATVPIHEDFPTGGTTNPYGTTKLFLEQILIDYCKAAPEMNVALLRYFNPIGAHESGLIGEDPNGIPNNLVPYIAQVAVGKLKKVSVYGDDYPTPDGTGVRDYIHVVDLAVGHVKALKKLDTKCGLFICNLGTGKGYSVLDVIHAYEAACGNTIPYELAPRRSGDIASCYADPRKAREELGWEAQFGIAEMCASSWKWQSTNPNGYATPKEELL